MRIQNNLRSSLYILLFWNKLNCLETWDCRKICVGSYMTFRPVGFFIQSCSVLWALQNFFLPFFPFLSVPGLFLFNEFYSWWLTMSFLVALWLIMSFWRRNVPIRWNIPLIVLLRKMSNWHRISSNNDRNRFVEPKCPYLRQFPQFRHSFLSLLERSCFWVTNKFILGARRVPKEKTWWCLYDSQLIKDL